MTMNPPPLDYEAPPAGRYDLRAIATRQRGLISCILVQICCVIAQFVVPENLRLVVAVVSIVTSVAGLIFMIMLSLLLYSTVTAVLLGLSVLIPIIGLIVLLVVNSRATNILRASGMKVGLLGASVPPGL